MTAKKYYWLKLKEDFFRQKEIKKLRKIAGGDTYTIIYLKLQLLSLQNEGLLFYEGTEETFEEQLSLEIDENLENVKVTLGFLFNNNLIEEANNEYLLPRVTECIGKEGRSAERVRKHREKQALENKKGQSALQCNTEVTKCNTETETEQEIETELEIEQQHTDIEKILKNNFDTEEIDSIRKYCIENNVVDDVVVEKIAIINHMKKIRNKVGALLTAIKEDWKPSKSQSNYVAVPGFNNFKAREYDYDDLEKKLLGWDN